MPEVGTHDKTKTDCQLAGYALANPMQISRLPNDCCCQGLAKEMSQCWLLRDFPLPRTISSLGMASHLRFGQDSFLKTSKEIGVRRGARAAVLHKERNCARFRSGSCRTFKCKL